MVYFARIDLGKFQSLDATERTFSIIKIGKSDNVQCRMGWLRHHFQKPITLLATMPGSFREEAAMHHRFAHLRVQCPHKQTNRGHIAEWFYPTTELMDFIKNLSADF